MISKKEFIIVSVEYDNSSVVSGTSITRKDNQLNISLARPLNPLPFNTLLILYPGRPISFVVVSRDWLSLQKLIQNLYLSRMSERDIFKEALAQKLTRVGSYAFIAILF